MDPETVVGDGKERTMTCQHEGCTCQVAEGEQFCGDVCRQHGSGSHGEHACDCGHPECAGTSAM